jgi:hypothetical protein
MEAILVAAYRRNRDSGARPFVLTSLNPTRHVYLNNASLSTLAGDLLLSATRIGVHALGWVNPLARPIPSAEFFYLPTTVAGSVLHLFGVVVIRTICRACGARKRKTSQNSHVLRKIAGGVWSSSIVSAVMAAPREESKDRLRRIQLALGVEADGLLGPQTLTALEKRLGITIKESAASMQCTRRSLELIIAFEVGSPKLYEQRYRRPIWPGGASGVTIGIGYDLGHVSLEELEADWGPHLEEPARAALRSALGVRGQPAEQLAKNLRSLVDIPYGAAEQVFHVRTLPRYAARTLKAFSGVEKLPADAQGAMLSLVYNRGPALKAKDGSRAEMAEIGKILADDAGDKLERIAAQFESMTRLWPTSKGLRDRRITEAAMVRGARRKYAPGEQIRV